MSNVEQVDFTTQGDAPLIVCQRCLQSFEAGTELFYMHDNKPNGRGKEVCSGCRQYYLKKTETRQRELTLGNPSVQITPDAQQPIVSSQGIHKAVAMAQRSGQSHPIRLGQQFKSTMPPPLAPSSSSLKQKSIINRDTWPKRTSGSKIATHSQAGAYGGQTMLAHPIVVPKFITNSDSQLGLSGYQEAHQRYDEMRQFFAKKAMSVHGGEVVVIKVTMMSLKPGYKSPSVVSNISETIANIPVYIGVQALKNIAYLTLLPPFMKWAKNDTLDIEDLRLRFKDWVELVPLGPGDEDVNAIASKFFVAKGKLKTVQFHPGKGLELYLELSYSRYAEILLRLEELEEEELQPRPPAPKMSISYIIDSDIPRSDSLPPPSALVQKDVRKRRRSKANSNTSSLPRAKTRLITKSASDDDIEIAQNSVEKTPPNTQQVQDDYAGSPTADDVRRALQAQVTPSKKIVKSILNTVSVQCTVYPTATISFSSLIGQARSFDAIRDSEGPTSLTLIYNPNAPSKYGSFKKALFGHLSHAIIGNSTNVCIKQCWYLDKASGSRLVYDKYTQIAKLSAEINCLRWASALMGIVYEFITKHVANYGAPSFEIPTMRFVKNALLIGDEAFMVEEIIDEETDGTFVKYIGNGSVKPFDFLNGPAAYRAKFLAFSQHVQHLKTRGLAFIGDFQGGPSLLTDPQIITAPSTGLVFSDGNLSSTHTNFPSEHICNNFCEFFKLPTFSRPSSPAPATVTHG